MSQLTKPNLPSLRNKTILLTLAATLIISTSSLVQAKESMQSKEPGQRPCFSSIDTNKDGVISNNEFVSHKPSQRKNHSEDGS